MEAVMILPETGRGTMRSMVEGYVRVIPTPLASIVGTTSAYPSTIGCADGPPPRAGEEI